MKIRNTLITTLVALIGLVCVFVVYAIINRLPHWSAETVTLSSVNIGGTVVKQEEALIKINSSGTGKTFLYKDGSWKLIKESIPVEPTKMGVLDTVGITGKGGFDSNGFTVSLYNGTRWHVTGLKIDLNVKCTNKDNGFERNYYEKTDIGPYSEGSVLFNISRPADYESHTWGIVGEYGVPELPEEKNN